LEGRLLVDRQQEGLLDGSSGMLLLPLLPAQQQQRFLNMLLLPCRSVVVA
jgi:hypothetical protein